MVALDDWYVCGYVRGLVCVVVLDDWYVCGCVRGLVCVVVTLDDCCVWLC